MHVDIMKIFGCSAATLNSMNTPSYVIKQGITVNKWSKVDVLK